MKTPIATLLKKFGSKIGLGETLDLGEEGNIRLNLPDDLGIDFEEDINEPHFRKKLWIYITLSQDDLTKQQLAHLLEAMHEYHRSIEAYLMMPSNGLSVVLTSFFPNSFLPEPASSDLDVDQLDDHLKNLVSLATFLRSLIGLTPLEKPVIPSSTALESHEPSSHN